MKSLSQKHWLVVGAVMLTGATVIGGLFGSSDRPEPDLTIAHTAFTKGQPKEMLMAVKRVLENPGSAELEKRNALDLVEEAFKAQGGTLPVDWKLPSEIKKFAVAVRRRTASDGVQYSLRLKGVTSEPKQVTQLELTRFPSEKVLDKQLGIGEWQEENGDEGPEFYLRGPNTNEPPSEGLYLLKIVLKDGTTTDGWVLLSNLVSSESPKIQVPSLGQVFGTPNPTLKWLDFKSPQYKAFEGRVVSVGVVDRKKDSDDVWAKWQEDPSHTEATVGTDPDGKGADTLKNGKYLMYLVFSEKRKFGDVILRRESSSTARFSVSVRK